MKNLRNKNHPPNADLVQLYLQSSWDIVTAVYEQLDALAILADAIQQGEIGDFLTSDDFSSFGQAIDGTNNDTVMTPLRVAQAIAVLAAGIKNTYDGVGIPTNTTDSSLGYSAGSVWIDNLPDPKEAYRCVDATENAAVWIHTTLTADELAAVAISGNSDDLVEGASQLLMTIAERVKLGGIQDSAQQNAPLASQAEAEAGADNTKTMTPLRVAEAIAALSVTGLVWTTTNSNINVAKNTGTVFRGLGASVTATLPASPTVGDALIIINNDNTAGFPYNVGIDAGAGNHIVENNVTVISTWNIAPGTQATLVCFDAGVTKKWHISRNSGGTGGGISAKYIDAPYIAEAGDVLLVDTAAAAPTITLPAVPGANAYVVVADGENNATANNILVERNGKTIAGLASDFTIDVSGGQVAFLFVSAEDDWKVRVDFSVDDDLDSADVVAAVAASSQYGLVPWGSRANLQAASWYDGTTPADFGAFTRTESDPNGAMYGYRTASGTVNQEAQATSFYPERTDVDTHGFKFYVVWLPTTAGAGNVKFEISAVGYTDGDEISKPFTVGATIVDACQLSSTKVHVSPLSAAFTFSEAQLPLGVLSHWRIRRLATDPDDTYASDIRIFQVVVCPSYMALNDNNGNDF